MLVQLHTGLVEGIYAQNIGGNIPVLRLLGTNNTRVITAEAAFASYMLTFSIRP